MTGYSHHKCSALEFTEEIFMFFYHWGLTLIRLVGIMLETIMINPRSMKTIPMWKVVTQESDLSGGARTWCSSSSSSVPTLATLCRFVQMMDCPAPPPATPPATPTPLSRLILLSLLWCLFSLSILTAIALWMAEVSGILSAPVSSLLRVRVWLEASCWAWLVFLLSNSLQYNSGLRSILSKSSEKLSELY